jgi:hypothetical protein
MGRPTRVFHRDEAARLREQGMSWRQISAALGVLLRRCAGLCRPSRVCQKLVCRGQSGTENKGWGRNDFAVPKTAVFLRSFRGHFVCYELLSVKLTFLWSFSPPAGRCALLRPSKNLDEYPPDIISRNGRRRHELESRAQQRAERGGVRPSQEGLEAEREERRHCALLRDRRKSAGTRGAPIGWACAGALDHRGGAAEEPTPCRSCTADCSGARGGGPELCLAVFPRERLSSWARCALLRLLKTSGGRRNIRRRTHLSAGLHDAPFCALLKVRAD